MLTTIEYIEDPASLIYVQQLSCNNIFDIPLSEAPVFIFLTKSIHLFIQNIPMSFSIIGGVSIYLIIFFTTDIIRVPLLSLEGIFISFLLFFNPLLWINGNRFGPSLLATAIVLGAFNYLLIDNYFYKQSRLGWLLTGLLIGLKISFLPLLILPMLYFFYKRTSEWKQVFYIFWGISIWLIPILLFGNLSALRAFTLHAPEAMFLKKVGESFLYLWSDGFGGYWIDRLWMTVLIGFGNLLFLFFGILVLFDFDYPRKIFLTTLASIFIFWISVILFNESDIYPRQLLPIIPFLAIGVTYGIIYFLINFNNLTVKILCGIYMVSMAFISVKFAVEHKKPTAIIKVKNYLIQRTNPKTVILAKNEVIYYLKYFGVEGTWISTDDEINKLLSVNPHEPIICIGGYGNLIGDRVKKTVEFKHNPLVNRFDPKIRVYQSL